MDVLLSKLRTGSDGVVERHDTEFSGEHLIIGSAADANIQLLGRGVAARHATLTRDGNRLRLRCSRDCHARHNGKEADSATLALGDVLEIAGNRLELAAPPAGFDFAIEVHVDSSADSSQFEQAFQTDIDQAWISKRKLAWLSLGLVLVVGLALPLAGVLLRDADTPAPGWLPSDELWSTGALVAAHTQAAGTQCGSCHKTPFTRVRDTECRECHRDVSDHVHADRAVKFGIEEQRCASCHREHGAMADLIPRTDSGCTTCHARAESLFADAKLEDVHGFEPKEHPLFSVRLKMPPPAAAASDEWQTIKTPLAGAQEASQLKFSHEQHLDAARVVRNSDGGALVCQDCHRPLDKESFAPVTMQGACASCHELAFDPANRERQLPHGKPREVVLAIQEYFARRFSDPAAAPVVRERRRLPGRTFEAETCTAGALQCARQGAEEEIAAQFTKSGCVTCHEVVDTQAADIYERYQVVPVKLAMDFMPSARFDHVAHRIQGEQTGDTACMTCHAVKTSTKSTDLSLPNAGHCMDCHRTHPSREQIASPCAACHTYHPHGSVTPNAGTGSGP